METCSPAPAVAAPLRSRVPAAPAALPGGRREVKRLLMVAFHFPPSPTVGTRRSGHFARHLPALGWDITVLTARLPGTRWVEEHLPAVRVYRTPVFAPLAGLNRLRARVRGGGKRGSAEPGEGQPRTAHEAGADSPRRSRSRLRGAKDLITQLCGFPDRHVGWLPFAIPLGLELVRAAEADVVYTTSPPHSEHLIGWVLKRLTGRPWVADFRDPWARAPWLGEARGGSWHNRGQLWLEEQVARGADRLILNTPRLRDDFVAHHRPQDAGRFVSIPNGFDPIEFPSDLPPSRRDRFRILHAGTLYKRRNPLALLDAVKRLVEKGTIPRGDIEVCFLGGVLLGELDLAREIRDRSLEGVVTLEGWVPHQECVKRMAEAAVLLVVNPDTDVQVPYKVYEYIYLNRRLLALAHPGATADVVDRYRLGRVANPDVPSEVEAQVLALYREFRGGEAPGEADPEARVRFNVRQNAEELDRTLRSCL